MNLKTISNVELWNSLRQANPNFSNQTSKGTAELFTERGWSAFTHGDMTAVQDFWKLALPFYLNLINVARARDPLYAAGFGESYEIPWGGYIQRMSIGSVKPVSPAYRNLVEGGTVDPYVIRKAPADNRFFRTNFDYQSTVAIPDMWQTKQMFVAEAGLSDFLNGVYVGLENGYILQVYANKLEAIHQALTNSDYPLQDSQKVDVTLSDDPTTEELENFLLAVKNVITMMDIAAMTGAYNAGKFATVQDKSRLRLLVRAGMRNLIDIRTKVGAFNPEYLTTGVEIIEVPHFGGLQPYKEAAYTTPLYPVYDDMGAQIGYNETANQTSVTVENDEVFWKDPHLDTIAVLADKGVIFEMMRNPYQVTPIYNPRGMYQVAWANSPDNGIAYDPYYTLVQFKYSAPAGSAASYSLAETLNEAAAGSSPEVMAVSASTTKRTKTTKSKT